MSGVVIRDGNSGMGPHRFFCMARRYFRVGVRYTHTKLEKKVW